MNTKVECVLKTVYCIYELMKKETGDIGVDTGKPIQPEKKVSIKAPKIEKMQMWLGGNVRYSTSSQNN